MKTLNDLPKIESIFNFIILVETKTNHMKRVIIVFAFSAILASCNSESKTKDNGTEQSDTTTKLETDASVEVDITLNDITTDEALIATALMAAPEESRTNATVIGYNMAGEFVTLKEGSNEFICLADDPKKDGFSAACYHKNLEPFMARGRALKAEGKTFQEIFDIREAEAKSGKLDMGGLGSTLHIYFGSETQYNPETSQVQGAQYRYVVYMPWATAASTGLPEVPIAPNHPWIMNPGTHRAHIMISPIPKKKE